MTADWQVYQTTQWNYALALNDEVLSQAIRVTEGEVSDNPFDAKNTPMRLHVKGRKLPDWHAVDRVADPVPQGPVATDQADETITLIPYAAAKLRITAFPELKDWELVAFQLCGSEQKSLEFRPWIVSPIMRKERTTAESCSWQTAVMNGDAENRGGELV